MWWLDTFLGLVVFMLILVVISLARRLENLENRVALLKVTKQDSEDYIRTKKMFKEYN